MFRIERTFETEVFVSDSRQVTLRQVDAANHETRVELSAANARQVAAALIACAEELESSVPAAPRVLSALERAIEDIEPLLDFEPSEGRTLLHEVFRRHRRTAGAALAVLEDELERVTMGELAWSQFVPVARSEIARLRAG